MCWPRGTSRWDVGSPMTHRQGGESTDRHDKCRHIRGLLAPMRRLPLCMRMPTHVSSLCVQECMHPPREVTAPPLLPGGGPWRPEGLGSNWFWRFLPPLPGKLSLFHLQPDQSPVMCLSTWVPPTPQLTTFLETSLVPLIC